MYMATPKVKPEDRKKIGRPTAYREEYCELLINHMRQGGTLESFGSIAHCSIQTVYNWMEQHPEFLEARKRGMPLLHAFYENMGKTIATGQLRRLVREKPVIVDGKVMMDANGQTVYEREYEPATAGQAAFIFLTKNIIGYRDKKDINLGGQPDNPTPVAIEHSKRPPMTKDEIEARYRELQKKAVDEAKGG